MKFELLSTNLVQIINRCTNSQPLGKLLYYNGNNPKSQPAVNPSDIAPYGVYERINAYPFDFKFKGEERSQLHIYYPDVTFKNNSHVEETIVWFDVIVHKRLWLYMEANEKRIRPYDIASEIVRLFDGSTLPKEIFKSSPVEFLKDSTVGELNFLGMGHISVNEEFDGVRIEAKMTTY